MQPASFNLIARRYAASARAAARRAPRWNACEALYEHAPTMELLETLASLQPDPEARQSRLLAHLHEHPTLAAAQALLAPQAGHAAKPAEAATPPAALTGAETSALYDAVRRAARPLHRYRCAACGFEAEHYFWQCPGCLGWDTYPPQRLEDL